MHLIYKKKIIFLLIVRTHLISLNGCLYKYFKENYKVQSVNV